MSFVFPILETMSRQYVIDRWESLGIDDAKIRVEKLILHGILKPKYTWVLPVDMRKYLVYRYNAPQLIKNIRGIAKELENNLMLMRTTKETRPLVGIEDTDREILELIKEAEKKAATLEKHIKQKEERGEEPYADKEVEDALELKVSDRKILLTSSMEFSGSHVEEVEQRLGIEAPDHKLEPEEPLPPYLDPSHSDYASELAIALEAAKAVYEDGWKPNASPNRPPRQLLEAWIEEHYPDGADAFKKRIATVVNAKKTYPKEQE